MSNKKPKEEALPEQFAKIAATALYAAHDGDPLDAYPLIRIADEAETMARQASKLTAFEPDNGK
ncbi:MAG: hypothetical protein ABSA13_08095 [Beijerinckiaceae bacterium]|jgi:hypothetical protein